MLDQLVKVIFAMGTKKHGDRQQREEDGEQGGRYQHKNHKQQKDGDRDRDARSDQKKKIRP